MLNVGEQIVSSYLRYIWQCDFIQTNLPTTESQGEIDVVGLNMSKRQIYICEVAIHLGGLQYTTNDVKNGIKITRPDNVQRLTDKFSRGIKYAREHWSQYDHHFIFWSPIVKDTARKPENNQMRHLEEIKANIKEQYSVEIEFIVNARFQECLAELRSYAADKTCEFPCPLMRLMQIEEHIDKHLSKLTNTRKVNEPDCHVAQPAINIQTEKKTEAGYSEFWAPIRQGNGLFAGKPVLIRNDGYISKATRGVEVYLHLTNHQCYIRLWIQGKTDWNAETKLRNYFENQITNTKIKTRRCSRR